jgi:alcohol dehydrogenase YqhD (iron-dependent ADH family)
MICEFQNQHELDYADRRKAMNEKNVRTVLDNTVDDIQEARDDNGCDDAEETRWSSTHAMGGMLQQECKTRWTSTHSMSDSLMTMSQFPRLARMTRQYLPVLARFASLRVSKGKSQTYAQYTYT